MIVILFKISEVDYATYNFLRTRKLQQEMDNNFAQTTNLISNSGGLGIWSGYNSTYYKIPIVKDTVIKERYEPELFEILIISIESIFHYNKLVFKFIKKSTTH